MHRDHRSGRARVEQIGRSGAIEHDQLDRRRARTGVLDRSHEQVGIGRQRDRAGIEHDRRPVAAERHADLVVAGGRLDPVRRLLVGQRGRVDRRAGGEVRTRCRDEHVDGRRVRRGMHDLRGKLPGAIGSPVGFAITSGAIGAATSPTAITV